LSKSLVTCRICGKEFLKEDWFIKHRPKHHCSKECAIKSKTTKKLIKCSNCSKEFYKQQYALKRDNNHFCSEKCQHEFRRNRIHQICSVCGKKFTVIPSRLKNQITTFCSKECSYKALIKKRIKRNCIVCGKEFEFLENRLKYSKMLYCSHSCSCIHNRNGETRKCKNCGKEFYASNYNIKLDKAICCSMDCWNEYGTKENNPNYKHGHSWFKKYTKNNRKCKCNICNKDGDTLLHHIDGNKYNNKIKNYIELCKGCHESIHALNKYDGIEIKKALEVFKHLKLFNFDCNQRRKIRTFAKKNNIKIENLTNKQLLNIT